MKRTHVIAALFLLMLLVACGPNDEPTPVPEEAPTAEGAYPAPTLAVPATGSETEAYPPPTPEIPTPESYPPPTLTPAVPEAYPPLRPTPNEAKRFALDPARVGDEEVTGTGYPDTAIKIISISFAGEELGFGQTNADRSFRITLDRPLQDEVIAISLADSGQAPQFHDAPGTDIPMIGLIFDQQVVEP